MNKKINSFASHTEELTKNVNVALETLVQLNNSLVTNEDTVSISIPNYDETSGESVIETYNIPSYNNILNKVENVKNTVDTLTNGNGNIKISDGTYRDIKISNIAKTPKTIFGIKTPTHFKSISNWFFEDLLFPKMVIPFNLKNKIDDDSDRVLIKRLIINNENTSNIAWFKNNLLGKNLDYNTIMDLLSTNNIRYWVDEQEIKLPLRVNQFVGNFPIDKVNIIDGKKWYYLSNIYYSKNDESNIINNIELTIGDKLSFGNTSYIITDMVNTENRICVESIVGFDTPSVSSFFEYYCEPFSEKIVEVAISYNELDVLFFKGVNEEYNIVGDNWSKAVIFDTNELFYEGTDISMSEFYNKYVIDYGKMLEGQAKERFIPAYYGVVPNTPSLNTKDFRVVQINSHINASLESQNILNTQKQIIETKSQIESYKSTIAKQKQDLISKTSEIDRAVISDSIRSYTNKLNTLSTEYSSLVKSLSALAYENDSVETKPKYRIRGFFPIPELKEVNNLKEEIIQFEIAYRYLRLDSNNSSLNTFTFTDTDGVEKTGVFSDWNYEFTLSKSRIFDKTLDEFVWVNENVSSGEEININQLDISINKGERVEIKIRAISESGWPANPLKSEWSDSVIIEFPKNLDNTNLVEDILSQASSEETNIQLQETMGAAGVYTHLDDTIYNNNVVNGISYKHMANNIGVNIQAKNTNGSIDIKTLSVESVLATLLDSNEIIDITIPNTVDGQVVETTRKIQLSKLLSKIVNVLNLSLDDLDTLN